MRFFGNLDCNQFHYNSIPVRYIKNSFGTPIIAGYKMNEWKVEYNRPLIQLRNGLITPQAASTPPPMEYTEFKQ